MSDPHDPPHTQSTRQRSGQHSLSLIQINFRTISRHNSPVLPVPATPAARASVRPHVRAAGELTEN
jgi:hypothetical protein